jgi:hypothetical protein
VSILTYTVYPTRPRMFCTSSDQVAITAATDATTGWLSSWAGTITQCNGWVSSGMDLTAGESVYDRFFALGLAGWIENEHSYHDTLLTQARSLAQNTAIWYGNSSTSHRHQELALAYAYDWLRTGVITFPAADRRIIGDAIVARCVSSTLSTEYLDGHSAGDMMAELCCALAIYGESGTGYDYTTWATAQIDQALDFYYGATPGAVCRLDTLRYLCGDGGHYIGCWYSQLELWEMFWLLQAVDKGFVPNRETPNSLQLNGTNYAPLTDETWVAKLPEYVLNSWCRGDKDFFAINDTARVSNPFLHDYTRNSLAFLIKNGGAYRKQLRWLADYLHAEAVARGQYTAYQRAHEYVFWDPSDTDNASEAPSVSVDAPAKTRLFKPPGSFWHRNTWNYPESCVINIECNERYFYGHKHLNVGAMTMTVRDDVVLIGQSGLYNTQDSSALYGGDHHRRYHQQSIAHSCVPLFPCIANAPTQHSAHRASDGARVQYASGGGQLWKTWVEGGTTNYDCYNISSMRFDGAGLAWDASTVSLEEDNDDFAFLHIDASNAYVSDSDHGVKPVSCRMAIVVIKRESIWPIVFRLVTMAINDLSTAIAQPNWAPYPPGAVRSIPYHVSHAPSMTYLNQGTEDQLTRRIEAQGIVGSGKIVLDVWDPKGTKSWTSYGMDNINANGYGAHQFIMRQDNWPPTNAAIARFDPDLGRYTVEVFSDRPVATEQFCELYQPRGAKDAPVAYTWYRDNDWIGVRFSSSDHQYNIHQREIWAVMTGDNTPPAKVQGVIATPLDSAFSLRWTPNTEGDLDHYHVYYREKV